MMMLSLFACVGLTVDMQRAIDTPSSWKSIDQRFTAWAAQHQKSYMSDSEKSKRKDIFASAAS